MKDTVEEVEFNRRKFLKLGTLATASALLPSIAYTSESDKVKVAIIGCGRSGLKAAHYLLADGRVKIVALADIFTEYALKLAEKLREESLQYKNSQEIFDAKNLQVFTGLDCYKQAINSDAQLIILATPPVFREREFEAVINANKHCFLEKPICVDAVQVRKMRKLNKLAKQKKLTAIVGLQRRYHAGYQEAIKRLHDGQIGEIISAQCFWFLPHYDGMELKTPKDMNPLELEYQLKNWAMFVWSSGDHIVEQQIHNLDIMRWGMNRPPKFVNGLGGRGVDLPMPQFGNRFSHFAIDFDYGDGVKMQSFCRQEPGTSHLVLERFVGTKGILDTNLFTSQQIKGENPWTAKQSPNHYAVMFKELVDSVIHAKAINTVEETLDSNMLSISGRLSAYSGQKFKYQWAEMRSKESLFPEKLEFGKMPVTPLAVPGKYNLI